MSHYQGEDADYVADEYDMEDVDEDMDDDFRGRDSGASDSDVDDFDYSVCHNTKECSFFCVMNIELL